MGCNEEKLRDLLNRKVNKDNINEFGRFDELKATVDRQKAKDFYIKVEGDNFRISRLSMYIDKYLREFIFSGGVDSYPDTEELIQRAYDDYVNLNDETAFAKEDRDDNAEKIVTCSVKSETLRK